MDLSCLSKILNFVLRLDVLTFLLVVAAFFSLAEMRKQRQKSYEPQLFLSNLTLYLQNNSNGTPCILKKDFKEAKGLLSGAGPFFQLEIHNIGLGAANTILIKWIYDREKLIKRFNELGTKTSLLESTHDGHYKYKLGNELEDTYGFSIPPNEDSNQNISFLAANQKGQMPMSQALYNYLTFMPYLELKAQKDPRRIDMGNGNDFEILFTYYDVGGKRHNQKIKIIISIYAYSEEFVGYNYGIVKLTFKK